MITLFLLVAGVRGKGVRMTGAYGSSVFLWNYLATDGSVRMCYELRLRNKGEAQGIATVINITASSSLKLNSSCSMLNKD